MIYHRIDTTELYAHLIWSYVTSIYFIVSIYAIKDIWTDIKDKDIHGWVTFGLFLLWCVFAFMVYDMTESV